uniref:Uncharacterized protein n=1 Tax=Rhizophora mucronata TaxID=61149 RepID=A0A2P2PGA1_RHIMU
MPVSRDTVTLHSYNFQMQNVSDVEHAFESLYIGTEHPGINQSREGPG